MNITKKRTVSGTGTIEENFLVDMFGQITEKLRQKYNYSDTEILGLWSDNAIFVPAAIFAGNLSPAESIAKFLKENNGLSYHEIAELIGRDERSIWANYKRAIKKMTIIHLGRSS